jgi:glutathione-specific gamma-glutamylcyclotransferase
MKPSCAVNEGQDHPAALAFLALMNTLQPTRDPEEMLLRTTAQWGGREDLWVFGYASLIARPEFDADEHRVAHVRGWHRALRMRSRVNRGTPEQPGLVFALLHGGSCTGVVYRVPRKRAAAELQRLWLREMPTAVYDPRFLPCRTDHCEVRALAFTLSRRSPNFVATMAEHELLHIFKHARGRFGTTLDYLLETADALRRRGLRDREIERMVELARMHALA